MGMPWGGGSVPGGLAAPVVTGSGTAQGLTGSFASDDGSELVDAGVQDGGYDSSVAALFEISSKSACTFPCTSITTSA
jgi:hypothetical protein